MALERLRAETAALRRLLYTAKSAHRRQPYFAPVRRMATAAQRLGANELLADVDAGGDALSAAQLAQLEAALLHVCKLAQAVVTHAWRDIAATFNMPVCVTLCAMASRVHLCAGALLRKAVERHLDVLLAAACEARATAGPLVSREVRAYVRALGGATSSGDAGAGSAAAAAAGEGVRVTMSGLGGGMVAAAASSSSSSSESEEDEGRPAKRARPPAPAPAAASADSDSDSSSDGGAAPADARLRGAAFNFSSSSSSSSSDDDDDE